MEEIGPAVAAGLVQPHDPDYAAWLITQLAMAVFHHYDCAGLDEPVDQIAAKVWAFCLAALNAGPNHKAPSGSRHQAPRVAPGTGRESR